MARCDAKFKNNIRLRCYDALEAKGFVRFAKEGVDKPINDKANCWVGLNTALYPDRVEINPFVGVHDSSIAKLKAELSDGKYDRGVATYAVHIGEILPARNQRAFAFTPDQSENFVKSEFNRLAGLYTDIGFAYAQSIASYDALLPLLESRIDMLGGYPERLACCLYLMNEVDRARAFTEEFAEQEPDYFTMFADAFLKMVDDKDVRRTR